MSEVSILIIGDTRRREFRDARAVLDELGRVSSAADVESAEAMLRDGRIAPEVIVVAQAYPGEFSAGAIDRLRRLAPLGRLVGLLGSWCEGEMRTGRPWPASIRIYWHQWGPRVSRELRRLCEGQGSTWALPVTATEEERLLAAQPDTLGVREGLVAISTRCREMHDWLSSACRRRGYSTVWLPPEAPRAEGVTAAIFDTATLDAATLDAATLDAATCEADEPRQLRHLVAAVRPAPVIVLLDFPRIEDHARALAAGATAVLSKPLLIEDLYWQLENL
jgi:CheY-like chemotaxis protein